MWFCEIWWVDAFDVGAVLGVAAGASVVGVGASVADEGVVDAGE